MTPVDARHKIEPKTSMSVDTDEMRAQCHGGGLFQRGEIMLVYSHDDRMIPVSAVAACALFVLGAVQITGTARLLGRREMGIVNLCDVCEDHSQGTGQILFVFMGAGPVKFFGAGRFYFVGAPAHHAIFNWLVTINEANRVMLGAKDNSDERVIISCLDPDVNEICQLCMGLYPTCRRERLENHASAHP